MEQKMTHNSKLYLIEVQAEDNCYIFKLPMCNDAHDYPLPYHLCKSKGSIDFRLQRYKSFKKQLFGMNGFGSQIMDMKQRESLRKE